MTVDDLLTLPDDGWQYEVVEGVLVRVAGSGEEATIIAGLILTALNVFVRPQRLGRVTGADGVYRFRGVETGLLPDVGYYGSSFFPQVLNKKKPVSFAPELAVEVVSPSQDADDMAAKARQYLVHGTRLVWVVWPDARTVDVWRPADVRPRWQDMRPSTTFGGADALDGMDVLPGFSHPVADIFDI